MYDVLRLFTFKYKLNQKITEDFNITNKLSIKLGQLNKKPLKSLTKFLN